jgi:hypothetical protein
VVARLRRRRVEVVPAWERTDEYAALCRSRLEHLVPVREPLVLVSQVQRSGGTLLSQLFDSHPECHAHPSEIYIGHPKKWNWPMLDLAHAEPWFAELYERPVELHLREGYVKEKELRGEPEQEVYPFLFLPALQRQIFEACVAESPPARDRDVFDAYFTSYFNAWLDNQNLYTGPKRAVTGFTPRLAMDEENVERFFAAYPDGTLISIVRDPRGWYASAHTYRSDQYDDVGEALAVWTRSTEAALAAHERFGERVVVLTYEQLVLETEPTMRRVAERIGVSMSPTLVTPTFNGRPVRANSSQGAAAHGIIPGRAVAHRETLDGQTTAQVEEVAGDLYASATAVARASG